jgi:hypothetical protein
MDVLREKPSTRARSMSYGYLRSVMHLLYLLDLSCGQDYYSTPADQHGWKEWVIKYTPPHKRGGSDVLRRKSKNS